GCKTYNAVMRSRASGSKVVKQAIIVGVRHHVRLVQELGDARRDEQSIQAPGIRVRPRPGYRDTCARTGSSRWLEELPCSHPWPQAVRVSRRRHAAGTEHGGRLCHGELLQVRAEAPSRKGGLLQPLPLGQLPPLSREDGT